MTDGNDFDDNNLGDTVNDRSIRVGERALSNITMLVIQNGATIEH